MVQDSIRDKIFLIHFKSRITVFENKWKGLIFNHMFDTFLTLESFQFQVHFSHFWSENWNIWKMKIHCVGCVLKIRVYCCQRNGNHLVGGLVLKDVLQRRASSLYSSSREIWGTSLVMAEAVVVEREMKMAVLSRLLSVQPWIKGNKCCSSFPKIRHT